MLGAVELLSKSDPSKEVPRCFEWLSPSRLVLLHLFTSQSRQFLHILRRHLDVKSVLLLLVVVLFEAENVIKKRVWRFHNRQPPPISRCGFTFQKESVTCCDGEEDN